MKKSEPIKLFSPDLMNAIDVLIVVLDLQGRIVFVNAACEKLSGFKLEDVKDKPVWDVYVAPDEIQDTKAVFSALITFHEDNKHTNYWKTNTGDQKLVSFSNTCLRDDEGKLVYIVATGIDITEQRKNLLALEAREAKFQSIIQTAPDAIIIINEQGVIDEVNPVIEKVFGYKPDELIGQNIAVLMPEPYRSEHDHYLNNYKATGDKKIIGVGRELRALHKNGTSFPIYLSVSEIWLGNSSYFTGIIRDLTKVKEQEEKLRRAHKVEALGQLTGGIAHDFNNLLTIILGNMEILERQNIDADAKEIIAEVFDVVNQGSQLVSQLLAFGKRQSLNPESVDINEVSQRLTKLLVRTLGENIEIEMKLKPNLWKTHVDPTQLENSLLNIMINARDAMQDGGKIIIKTDNVEFTDRNIPKDLNINGGEYVEVSIIDTGTGMSPDVIARVFDPFFTTKAVGMGTGLGLSMVHGFVEQSSGGVTVESEEGHGTVISIYLPRTNYGSATDASENKAQDQFYEGIGCKILHVEDDPKVRQINTRRLIALGYDVLTAKDAPSALKILSKNEDVRIVFSDIVMPGGMTGIELADEIRVRNPDAKVLLTTGYSNEVLTGRGESYQILKKPFSKEDLARKLYQMTINLRT